MSRFKRWWDWSSYQWTLCSWWHLRTEMPRWLHQIQFLWLKDQVKEVIISWFTGAFFFQSLFVFFLCQKKAMGGSMSPNPLKITSWSFQDLKIIQRTCLSGTLLTCTTQSDSDYQSDTGQKALVGKVSTQILKSWFRNLRFQSFFTLLMVQKSGHHQFIRTRFPTCQVVIAGFLPSTVLFCILSPASSMYTCVAMGTNGYWNDKTEIFTSLQTTRGLGLWNLHLRWLTLWHQWGSSIHQESQGGLHGSSNKMSWAFGSGDWIHWFVDTTLMVESEIPFPFQIHPS